MPRNYFNVYTPTNAACVPAKFVRRWTGFSATNASQNEAVLAFEDLRELTPDQENQVVNPDQLKFELVHANQCSARACKNASAHGAASRLRTKGKLAYV